MEIAKNLIETLKRLSIILDEAHIPYCLIGGLAVGILAKPRATEDIDLLILLEEEGKDPLANLLRKHFTIIHDDTTMHFKDATIWRVVFSSPIEIDECLVIVDFLFADNDIFRKAIQDPVYIKIDNEKVAVAKPESLIAIKQLSNRPQDLIDIESIRQEYPELH